MIATRTARQAGEQGAALVLALLVGLLVHAVALAAAAGAVALAQRHAASERRVAAFHAAEAGLVAAVQALAADEEPGGLAGEVAGGAAWSVGALWDEPGEAWQGLTLESAGESRGAREVVTLRLRVLRDLGGEVRAAAVLGWERGRAAVASP